LSRDEGSHAPDDVHLAIVQSAIERLRRLQRDVDLPAEQQMLLAEALADLASLETGPERRPLRTEFEALAGNAPDMIARLDPNQHYLYVNPVVEETMGLPAEAFLGKRNRELGVPEEIADLWERKVTRVLETGQQEQFRFEATTPEGTRHYEGRLAPEMDRDGGVISVLAIVRDTTERERTRQILLRYAKRLRFLHQVEQAIRAAYSAEELAEAVLPHVQQLLACSRVSVALYDLPAREASLLAVWTTGGSTLAKGEHLALDWTWLVDELAQGHVCTVEDLSAVEPSTPVIDTLRAEGVNSLVGVPLIVQGTLIGSLNLGMATVGSLTAEQEEIAQEVANQLAIAIHQANLHEQVRQHAQALERRVAKRTAALQASEARFRAIFENSAVGIALVDTDGQVVSGNPALHELLGYDLGELEGMSINEFIHPDDRQAGDQLFQELLAGERNHFKMEKRYVRKDGTTIWVHPTVSLVRPPRGPARYAIKMVEDITEQRQAREALIQAERLTLAGQLGASLAHEISNPLQAVIGSLGLVEEMVEPGADVHLFIQIALEELDRTADIVAQLRDLNRRSEPTELEPTQLNDVVDKVLMLIRKECEAQHVEIEWSPADDLPQVAVVPDRIRQVFLNLVLNAIEVMPEGGRLRVSSARTRRPEGVQITFADTGPGIAPELRPHLFQPFQSTRPDGLGLGLYISKTIVDEHNGEIQVDSQPGEGATFIVWLPSQAPRAAMCEEDKP
jgi:PAS domain S-box-containing protein